MIVPKSVEKYAPTLVFSVGESYFPCDLFFASKKVTDNKQKYDELNSSEKWGKTCCYYQVSDGQDYTVYQYWYYYAHNLYSVKYFHISNDHEHDLECVKIFVGKESGQPEFITCNIHRDRQIAVLEKGVVPEIRIELGGHGMLANTQDLRPPWYWRGKSDKKLRVPPLKSCEALRLEVLEQPFGIMDKTFKLVGSDYRGVGRYSAPLLPWARWEYYLPEETLIGVPERRLPAMTLVVDQTSSSFLEAVELGRKKGTILREQYETLKSLVPDLHAENEIVTPPLEVFFGREIYAEVMKKVGINSMEDVMMLDPQKIHLRMKSYTKKQKMNLLIPSSKDIKDWQEEVTQTFG